MRILVEGPNLDSYLAKCHEALRTGLKSLFSARFFGKGYKGYWPASLWLRSFPDIVNHIYREEGPDWLFTQNIHRSPWELEAKFAGLEEVEAKKAILLADYWPLAEKNFQALVDFVAGNRVDLVFSYFPQPLSIWGNTPIAARLRYLPPSFDPRIFNDWHMPKRYDVGFLAAGSLAPTPVYPERYAIHTRLLEQRDLKYLWAQHPGWKRHGKGAPLVGRGFSEAINSCRIFITTGGVWRNAHAKYVEALASNTLLMADEPVGAEAIGLVDGVNYVRISQDDVIEKVRYYLARPGLCEGIANEGYKLAMTRHNCFARALEFYNHCNDLRPGAGSSLSAPAGRQAGTE